MRKDLTFLEPYRQHHGQFGTKRGELFGEFTIPFSDRTNLMILVADSQLIGWEQVTFGAWDLTISGDYKPRLPLHEEMVFVKERFWEDEETVVQIFPPKVMYAQFTDHLLHLWRIPVAEHPIPPAALLAPLGN